MEKSKLEKLGAIVNIMDEFGWEKIACDMSLLDREVGQFLADIQCDGYTVSPIPIRKLFVELAVASAGIAEAKYNGYCELLKNANKPELLDSIAHKHKEAMQLKENERNVIVAGISEAMTSLQNLQERIVRLGNIQHYAQSE